MSHKRATLGDWLTQKGGIVSQVQGVRSDLMLLMRREALSDYSLACANAQIAAEKCAAVTSATSEMVAELRTFRATVVLAAEALELVGDDVAAPVAWDLPLDARGRELAAARIRIALGRVSGDLESSEHEILDAADKIKRLRAMLAELELG